MATTTIAAGTVEVPTEALINSCATLLAAEERILAFCDRQPNGTSKALFEAAYDLLTPAVNGRPIRTDAEGEAMARHPIVVETHARACELAGDSARAKLIRDEQHVYAEETAAVSGA